MSIYCNETKTGLFLALELDYFDIAKFLIEKGADVNIKCINYFIIKKSFTTELTLYIILI